MDCWTSSVSVDDEFEKLVLRVNPPRYLYFLNFHVNLVPLFVVSDLASFCLFFVQIFSFLEMK